MKKNHIAVDCICDNYKNGISIFVNTEAKEVPVYSIDEMIQVFGTNVNVILVVSDENYWDVMLQLTMKGISGEYIFERSILESPYFDYPLNLNHLLEENRKEYFKRNEAEIEKVYQLLADSIENQTTGSRIQTVCPEPLHL